MQPVTYYLALDASVAVHAYLQAHPLYEIRDVLFPEDSVTLRVTGTLGFYKMRSTLASFSLNNFVKHWMADIKQVVGEDFAYTLSKVIGEGVIGNVQEDRVPAK
jgi:hypothetical protein